MVVVESLGKPVDGRCIDGLPAGALWSGPGQPPDGLVMASDEDGVLASLGLGDEHHGLFVHHCNAII